MEDFNNYNKSRSHGNNGQMMQQMERYCGGAPPQPTRPYDLRSYSVSSYAQAPNNYNKKDLKMMKKGKSMSSRTSSSISKSWSFATDPEIQRKKRVASYKMYTVEGKVKGSFRKSFRWLKDRYCQVVYGWW